MNTIAHMIEQLESLKATTPLTGWEAAFIANIAKRYHHNDKRTDFFSISVCSNIKRIWSKYFA